MEKGKRVSIRQLQLRNLEELQAYQRLGTVEELKSMKENGAFSGVELAQIYAMQRKLRQYQEIGTVEEFKALKEKNKPKEVTEIHCDEYYCPACHSENNCDEFTVNDTYCPVCGQALKKKGNKDD